jgi:phosphatidylserine decarboxylase
MYTTLLFNKSPLIAGVSLLILIVLYNDYKTTSAICVIILICLMIFYRYKPTRTDFSDNIIISPAEGKITNITYKNNLIHISIFMSVLNNHTQIYPINGTVIDRVYDQIGKFDIVVHQDKCRENKKKIHTILSNNNKIVTVTQIAGFLPRRISSSELFPEPVNAGQYLGMIKFGSRIDISFPGDINNLHVKVSNTINTSDIIYQY